METVASGRVTVPRERGSIVLGLVVGVLPAVFLAWLMWWFDHELARNSLPGNAPYGTYILFGLWIGVTLGTMYAVVLSRRAWVGVVTGVLSGVPLMIADVVTAVPADRIGLLASPRMWMVQWGTVLVPVAAGILFGLKNLEVNDGP